MNVKALLGGIYILLALYLANLSFSFIELTFLDSVNQWILIAIAILMAFESITYFKSNREKSVLQAR